MAKPKKEVKNLFEDYDSVYIVEKGVEMPPVSKGGGVFKYPFLKMDIGDSFAAPKTEAAKLRSASSLYSIKSGKRFTVRTLGDVVRVWRQK